ncbi:hypothetical protein [Sphingomonas bacterium]|uniref:hypothetical protein n=1 Tax=Sphingomonas bacterium TaxID=1895847 RepID=UPI0020C5DEB7|nr:hypothetical protein [Sphingomonas bacterium]
MPGRSAPGLVTVGVAERGASPAIDGGDTVRTRRGVFQFANSAGADRIDRSAIGRPAYVVDDQTVALTDAAGTRSLAGQVRDVEALGVWVEI